MGSSLKSFIKDIRASKTLAEERSIIQKESAKIRTKLRDDHLALEKRRRNIQKLLYLFILGEKTYFGQVECINLIASDDFVNKRLGYLSAILLLDESQDLLTLLTNLLNNDLNHPNKYIVSLALNTLGFLSSSELARDLYPDVENLLKKSKDPFLLTKALQCAAKLITKDPSLLEIFAPDYLFDLLENHTICTHGVLLGINKVIQSVILCCPKYQEILREDDILDFSITNELLKTCVPFIPQLIALLGNLNAKSSQPEFDVKGVCDPFLQCSIIRTLKYFFQLELDEISEYVNKFEDLLTQVATNTDNSKTSGQAVLYECARTIFSLNSEQPLRIMGINILAKFLSGKDNNIKYVALNALLQVVPQEPTAVQRHRKFIIHCLRDADISIKMRALELTFSVLNEDNIVELVDEIIKFLENTTGDDRELIVYTIENLISTFDKFQIEEENWKLNVFLKVLKLVGSYISLEKISDILIMINNAKKVSNKTNVLRELLKCSLGNDGASNIDDDNMGWKLVTVWCLGEYADQVLNSDPLFTEDSILQYLIKLDADSSSSSDHNITQYILTASLKLSCKIQTPKHVESLRQIIISHTKDSNLLIQTKSVQFELIFTQPPEIKKSILDGMPAFERKIKTEEQKPKALLKKKKAAANQEDLLFDILNIEDTSPQANAEQKKDNPSDLIKDIFGDKTKDVTDNQPNALSSMQLPSAVTQIYDATHLTVYSKEISSNSGIVQMELYFKAKGMISNLSCLCAVTKTQKLTLGPLVPSHDLQSNDIAKQLLKVTGTGKLKIRVKINFSHDGQEVNEQFDHKFEQTL